MQWLMLVLTLIAMTILQRLARAGPLEARATLALGFLIIAAQLGGALARRVRLPRITGFLVTGVVVGRLWLHLVRPDELDALRFMTTGALALIAFGAGSELRIARFRDPSTLRGTGRILIAAMAAPFLAVMLVVLSASPWFPLSAHQPFRDGLTVALILGAVAAMSSPVVTWAVNNENGARSPFAQTMLDVSIMQDVLAVLVLVLFLLIAQPLSSSGATRPGAALGFLVEAIGSIAVGVALALVLTQYARLIQRHVVLVLVSAAFLVAQAVRLLGLEPVLIGLAAGCTFANAPATLAAPAHVDAIKSELSRCAVPVYTVFFALAGADLRLDVLRELWPWALLLAGLRFTYLWAGMRWARQRLGVSPEIAAYGWLGLVSQGGLVIAIAAVLRRAFPEWGVTLEELLVAMVGIHLIAGPVCLQWALRRVGDVPEEAHAANNAETGFAVAAGANGSM